jgi:hypothetical protein
MFIFMFDFYFLKKIQNYALPWFPGIIRSSTNNHRSKNVLRDFKEQCEDVFFHRISKYNNYYVCKTKRSIKIFYTIT